MTLNKTKGKKAAKKPKVDTFQQFEEDLEKMRQAMHESAAPLRYWERTIERSTRPEAEKPIPVVRPRWITWLAHFFSGCPVSLLGNAYEETQVIDPWYRKLWIWVFSGGVLRTATFQVVLCSACGRLHPRPKKTKTQEK